MRGKVIYGILILSVLLSMFLVGTRVNGSTVSVNNYRLTKSNEYMDKTYIFDLKDQSVGTSLKVFCAEHNVPTFDAKKGLIDWVDYNAYGLEQKFQVQTAGRIRAIIDLAGPHVNKEYLIQYFQEYLGIEKVTYEQVVSAVQYSLWYYTDQITQIPTSENGVDIYKYLISLPPKSSSQLTDMLRVSDVEIKRNSTDQTIEMSFKYDTSGYTANSNHTYNQDIQKNLKGTESVKEVAGGGRIVTLKIPIKADEMSINVEAVINGSRQLDNDIYVFLPKKTKEVQAMVGYTRLNQSIGLDQKKLGLTYTAHQLKVENDGKIVTGGFTKGSKLSIVDINAMNPSGKKGYTFEGWYYKDGSKVSDTGLVMDGPKYVLAEYKIITTPSGTGPSDSSSPTGTAPDGQQPNQPTDSSIPPTSIASLPEDQDPENPMLDDDITIDDPDIVPEGIPDIGPNQPTDITGLPETTDPSDLSVIPDPDTPQGHPKGSFQGLVDGEGNLFYNINRFIESAGVPFLIFLALGILSIMLGVFMKQKEEPFDINEEGSSVMAPGMSDIGNLEPSLATVEEDNNPF